MNAIVTGQIEESRLIEVLTNSLYPGAKPDSVRMVLGYCTASGLDPMQKPVHIVPMWDAKSQTTRDVVMPGIGLYRTQAARSGQYAGVSEPEFGPDVTKAIGGMEVTFPAWCKVSIKRRLPTGELAEFSATERWLENYAAKGGKEKSIAPNAMWARRPYGQIAKCAEAQALRKAFPEVGSQPTADEMEGKTVDMGMAQEMQQHPQVKPPYPAADFEKNFPKWVDSIRAGKLEAETAISRAEAKGALTEEQKAAIRAATADVVDGETGELTVAAKRASDIDAAMRSAKTLQELDAASKGIPDAPESAQEALTQTYYECRDELTGVSHA